MSSSPLMASLRLKWNSSDGYRAGRICWRISKKNEIQVPSRLPFCGAKVAACSLTTEYRKPETTQGAGEGPRSPVFSHLQKVRKFPCFLAAICRRLLSDSSNGRAVAEGQRTGVARSWGAIGRVVYPKCRKPCLPASRCFLQAPARKSGCLLFFGAVGV
jgi:hypothetical protein